MLTKLDMPDYWTIKVPSEKQARDQVLVLVRRAFTDQIRSSVEWEVTDQISEELRDREVD